MCDRIVAARIPVPADRGHRQYLPEALYAVGDRTLLRRPAVSLVGGWSEEVWDASVRLVAQGYRIMVSLHETLGCVMADRLGGRVVGVMGMPLRPSCARYSWAYEVTERSGLVLSEYETERESQVATSYRLMALLSVSTVAFGAMSDAPGRLAIERCRELCKPAWHVGMDVVTWSRPWEGQDPVKGWDDMAIWW